MEGLYIREGTAGNNRADDIVNELAATLEVQRALAKSELNEYVEATIATIDVTYTDQDWTGQLLTVTSSTRGKYVAMVINQTFTATVDDSGAYAVYMRLTLWVPNVNLGDAAV